MVELSKVCSKLNFIGPDKLRMFLAVEVKVELRNRANVIRLSGISHSITFDSTENYILIFVSSGRSLKGRLKTHAGCASGRPEIYDDSLVLFYDFC